nr:shikimate dehydrogenase [Wenzhouxiangella sp. XN79A]
MFGHPVTHSRSPELHRRFAAQLGLDVDYRAIDCPAGGLAEALDRFAEAGGSGCNLTVPLKAEGLALAASASAAARSAGACNTLVRRNGGWWADTTDGAGLLADLDRLALDPAGRRLLLVGAGGAMAGVLDALLERGPARIGIVNRSAAPAEALAARVRQAGVPVEVFDFEGGLTAGGFELALQGTSLGHGGTAPALDRDWLTGDATAYDLNYGPAHAPFAHWCAMHGVPCHGGWGMLVEQAAEAFERFTGRRPDTADCYAER